MTMMSDDRGGRANAAAALGSEVAAPVGRVARAARGAAEVVREVCLAPGDRQNVAALKAFDAHHGVRHIGVRTVAVRVRHVQCRLVCCRALYERACGGRGVERSRVVCVVHTLSRSATFAGDCAVVCYCRTLSWSLTKIGAYCLA